MLFERFVLGISPERRFGRHKRKRPSPLEKKSKKWLLRRALRDVPVDGRHAVLGVRGINPMEHLPGDLARHLQACGSSGNLIRGQRIHGYILGSDFRDSRFLAHRILEMYARCGCLADAQSVFNSIKDPNLLSWNYMLKAIAQNGDAAESKMFFDSMPQRDAESWEVLIAGYARTGHLEETSVAFSRMPEQSATAPTRMVVAYAQAGHLAQAQRMLDEMPEESLIAWNALAQAYGRIGHLGKAKQMLDAMPLQSLVSWSSEVKARAKSKHLNECVRVAFDRMPERSVSSWNAMIEAYGRVGQVDEARRLFLRMPPPSTSSWATIVKAFAQNGYLLEAKVMFDKAPQKEQYLAVALLSMHALSGQMEQAAVIFRKHKDATAWKAMVAGYVLSGQMQQAWKLLSSMPMPDTGAWNALLQGMVRQGSSHAFPRLADMLLMGVAPNEVTFISFFDCICTSKFRCCEELLDAARECFSRIREHGMRPSLEHYNGLVKILAQAGMLRDAEQLVDSMPFAPDVSSWTALFAGGKIHGNVELASRALRHIFTQDDSEEP